MSLPPEPPTPTPPGTAPRPGSSARKPLRLGSVFLGALQVLAERGSTIFSILAVASALSIAIGLIFTVFTDFSRDEAIDPRTVRFLLSGQEWIALGLSVAGMAAILFFAFDAIVQATDAHLGGKPVSIRSAFQQINLDHLWLLWIQLIGTALFAILVPWMAVLLWMLVASAVPAAMLENRSPQKALDRAWALMAGNIGKVAVVEVVLTLLLAIPPMILIPLFLTQSAPLGPEVLSPGIRMLLGVPLLMVALTPFAYMFITLTVMYRQLLGNLQPELLHANRASSVN